MKEADEYYLEARDAVLDAVKELDPRRDEFSAPGEVVLRVRKKPAWPLDSRSSADRGEDGRREIDDHNEGGQRSAPRESRP